MPRLTSISAEHFRCFSSRQTAHLAPLTFLVGANSTGKTSFLALLRELWNTVVLGKFPDFTDAPYHLGIFHDIVSTNGDDQRSKDVFTAELTFVPNWENVREITCSVEFRERGGIPFPVSRIFAYGSVRIELVIDNNKSHLIKCTTPSATWEVESKNLLVFEDRLDLVPIHHLMFELEHQEFGIRQAQMPVSSSNISLDGLKKLSRSLTQMHFMGKEPFAGAPVRSRPRRTYDLGRPSTDPEGENIPTYLASVKSRDRTTWNRMKRELESFGRNLGLFDSINVSSLKGGAGGPFQIEIKRHGANEGSSSRNLIDVGYGVSQVLPLLTELLRDGVADVCLLQQPEVHLHPSAQAALGTLFTDVCSQKRQLIVETHSDYLINRVRMDIRDRQCKIDEGDVSILYFESIGDSVRIHSIRIDEMGNVLGAPPSYRRFFTAEADREVQF